jgi:hypothetical protein
MFTRKIIRQPVPNRSRPIRPPDTIGPSIADSPITGLNTANALPISCGSNRSLIRPKTCGSMTAPASPAAARAAISSPEVAAAAQAAEAAMKTAIPISRTRLRP